MAAQMSAYSENSNYVQNNSSSDESINFSTSSENSEDGFELKSAKSIYSPNGKTKRLTMTTSLNRNPRRKPTRKPDPNTFNRNALMARENRRRKKEYVEKLEKEIHIYRGTNKNLRKIFKKQAKLIERLQKEKRYYRTILENKSQILSVIKTLNSKECTNAITLTNETPETSPSYSFTDSTNNNNNFGDIDYNLSFANHDSWEDILGSNSPFCEQSSNTSCDGITTTQRHNLQDIQSNIIDEHNYFNSKIIDEDNDDLYSDAGICLHFTSGGKISLEFCPTCHQKSTNKTILDKLMDE